MWQSNLQKAVHIRRYEQTWGYCFEAIFYLINVPPENSARGRERYLGWIFCRRHLRDPVYVDFPESHLYCNLHYILKVLGAALYWKLAETLLAQRGLQNKSGTWQRKNIALLKRTGQKFIWF
jgi:hypothetical protein